MNRLSPKKGWVHGKKRDFNQTILECSHVTYYTCIRYTSIWLPSSLTYSLAAFSVEATIRCRSKINRKSTITFNWGVNFDVHSYEGSNAILRTVCIGYREMPKFHRDNG